MRYARAFSVVTALVLALAPLTTHAQSAATLDAKRRANIQNDIARCQLAAAGVTLPGNVAPSQPEAVVGCGAGTGVRALQTLPSSAGKCPAVGRSKTKLEQDLVNDFEIARLKAMNKHTPLPTPSADVAALLAC
jgi:hypothetical protein